MANGYWIAHVVVAASALCVTAPHAAESYPVRPVRVIVPYAPGGNADIVARYLAERLSEKLAKQFVVDNRPGANGLIGTDLAAHAPADGYTLLLVAQGFTVNPALHAKMPYDTVRDLQPIGIVGDAPLLLIANNTVAAASVKELVALAKTRPGLLSYGSAGNGSVPHLAGALLEVSTATKLVHVPYKGISGALVDVVSGQIQLAFPSMSSVLAHVKSGKVKAYAITLKKRSAQAPTIPTMEEAGVSGYEAGIWNGMLAPAGTPRPIVTRVNEALGQILKTPQAAERYATFGNEIRYSTPEEFATFIRSEMVKWTKVINAAGIKADER